MQKVDLLKEYGLYINGEFVPASDGTTFAAHNPANGEALALCAEATKQDVDRAVKAAREALPSWSKTSPIERQNLLLKIADIIDENKERFCLLYTSPSPRDAHESRMPSSA